MRNITTLLDERLILLDADVTSAEQCIRTMADLFQTYGYVKPGYGDAVVEREKGFPTGLPGKGINIAIPHTNNALVNKPAVGVIVPRQAVEFAVMGQKETKISCELILPLVVQDTKRQMAMLKKMMKIIQDGELLQNLRHAKDKQTILQLLSVLNDD